MAGVNEGDRRDAFVRLTQLMSSPGGQQVAACSSAVRQIRRDSARPLRWCRGSRRWPNASNAAPLPSVVSCASTRSSGSPNAPARSASVAAAARAAVVRHGSCARPMAGSRSSLARPDDVDLVPAWLESDGDDRRVGRHRSVGRVEARSRARPARCPGRPADRHAPGGPRAERRAARPRRLPSRACRAIPRRSMARPPGIVQSGTLSSSISARCGRARCAVRCWPSAGVACVKVESTRRPDGARGGSPVFFDRMNGQKRSVALDLRTERGRLRAASAARARRRRDRGISPTGPRPARDRSVATRRQRAASVGLHNRPRLPR